MIDNPETILTLESKFPIAHFADWLVAELVHAHGQEAALPFVRLIRDGDLAPASVPVQVNHGSWIVRCLDCTKTQVASRQRRQFWCLNCKNARQGGLWLTVTWPDDQAVDRIEKLLLARPKRENRSWFPHETVADLVRENVEHGDPVVTD